MRLIKQTGVSVFAILAVLVITGLLVWGKVSYDSKQKANIAAEKIQAAKIEREKSERAERLEREKAERAEQQKAAQLLTNESEKISRIHANVRSNLKDPDSARFGQFFEVDSEEACIAVNAKNSLGGFTGEKFILLTKSQNGEWVVSGKFSSEYSNAMCNMHMVKRRYCAQAGSNCSDHDTPQTAQKGAVQLTVEKDRKLQGAMDEDAAKLKIALAQRAAAEKEKQRLKDLESEENAWKSFYVKSPQCQADYSGACANEYSQKKKEFEIYRAKRATQR